MSGGASNQDLGSDFESDPDLGAYDYEVETNRIVKKAPTKSSASNRRLAFKKA